MKGNGSHGTTLYVMYNQKDHAKVLVGSTGVGGRILRMVVHTMGLRAFGPSGLQAVGYFGGAHAIPAPSITPSLD